MKIVKIFFFTMLINSQIVFGQLYPPSENCPGPRPNIESNVCNSQSTEYSPCWCRYYENLRDYRAQIKEYNYKQNEIRRKLKNYQQVPIHGIYNLKNLTENEGFRNEQQRILSEIKKNINTLSSALSLSLELNSWCIENSGCGDNDIKLIESQIDQLNRQYYEILNTEPNKKIEITANSNYSNSNSISVTTNKKDQKSSNVKQSEKSVDEKKTSALDSKIQYNFNVQNEVQKAEQAGNFVRAAQLKNANSHLYSKEEIKISAYAALAQTGYEVLAKVFEPDPYLQELRRKRRKEYEDNKKSTLQEAITSDFSDNGLAVKRNKKGWYGFVDKNNNWVIKPKYIFAEPFKNGKAKVETKTGRIIFINKNGDKI